MCGFRSGNPAPEALLALSTRELIEELETAPSFIEAMVDSEDVHLPYSRDLQMVAQLTELSDKCSEVAELRLEACEFLSIYAMWFWR